ncbi:MAG: ATP-binding cassette domain-containing protein [Myxococcales bacterium]|jgi:phospholipid/cholesterol/gamma-HCH transport system ATP-binding protein|nr:ATP-binding cassette domain-containing protein [Myxococcales bacterium]
MITLSNVHKAFGGRPVLQGVDLTLERGTLTFLVGRSGAGKSVLSRCAVGLLHVDRGAIVIDGTEIGASSESALNDLRCRVPYVVQGSALIDWLTLTQNLEVPLTRALRLPRGEARARALRALHDVGLYEQRDSLPQALSAGDRKLLAIARAWALDPKAIFYDEPTTGLDPRAARRVDELIQRQSERGATSIVVSHDLASIRRIAQRVALLESGRIAFAGTTAEFDAAQKDHPAVHRFFHHSES